MAHSAADYAGLLIIKPQSEHFSEFEKFDTTQVLSEQVCRIVISAYVEDFDFFVLY